MSVEIAEAEDRLRDASAAYFQAKRDLADVRDILGPPRRKLDAMAAKVRQACIDLDETEQRVAWWRPPTREEVAWLDEARRDFLDEYAGALAEELRAKAAEKEWERRCEMADRDLKSAERKLRNRTRNPRRKSAAKVQEGLF